MTPADLDTIEARASAATKGRWEVFRAEHISIITYTPDGVLSVIDSVCDEDDDGVEQCDADARFIAASRQDVPLLCAALRRAWAVIEKLEGETK